jgi:DNA repair protein RadC
MQKQHYHGHRERIRKRFLQQGLEGFQDYEALELLLLFVARQKDMKPVGKALIEHFDSFKNVLDASPEELKDVEGVGLAAATLIHFVKQAAARYLQQTSQTRFSPDSPEALIHKEISELVNEALQRYLWEAKERKIDREMETYRTMHAELKVFPGQVRGHSQWGIGRSRRRPPRPVSAGTSEIRGRSGAHHSR